MVNSFVHIHTYIHTYTDTHIYIYTLYKQTHTQTYIYRYTHRGLTSMCSFHSEACASLARPGNTVLTAEK